MKQDDSKHKLVMAAFLMTILYIVSTLFYHIVEGWSILDSVYFVTTTFTTIGYGDHVPITNAGKIFTIFIAWIGISTGIYLIYSIIAYREKAVDQKIVNSLRVMRHLLHSDKKGETEEIKKKM